MDRKLSRRCLLATLATTTCIPASVMAAPSLDSVPLYPDDSHSLYRVRMMLEVEGNAEVPKNELVNSDVRKIGVEAGSTIDYEEDITRDADGTPQAARRYYYEASTKGKVQANAKESGLRNEARRAILRLKDTRSLLYSEETPLMSDEMELLRVPINSLAIDRLLPYKSVKVGEVWQIPTDVLSILFDMDAIQKSNISAKLTSFDAKAAKIELGGNIDASISGVPTSIRLRGKMTFDRKQRGVTWLAVAMREDRGIGKAEPGFEIAAQIRVIRQALLKPHAIRNREPIDYQAEIPGDKLLIDVGNAEGGFSVFCDRNWRVISENERFTMMRMIENDNVVGQCDIRPMPPLKDGHQLTLEAFQQDIQRTIGSRFQEFIEAEEKLTSNGLRLLRVVAQGAVEEIPVQWIYQHFSNDEGRRTAAIFTVADKQLETFAASDVQFAEGFRFEKVAESAKPSVEEVSSAETKSPETEPKAAEGPVEAEPTKIAEKTSDDAGPTLNPVLR